MYEMTPEQYANVQQIFLQLRDASPTQQEAVLAGQQKLIAHEVRSLLKADQSCGGFLEKGGSLEETERRALSKLRLSSGAFHVPSESDAGKPDQPRVIGSYRLLQKIGEGGFGVVYMAEQSEPVRRKVAIKLIKPGMNSKEVLARFQAERQALAMMEHSSIARVFDVGTSESGAPYFVMELVRGIPIDEFCEQNALPLWDRLRLMQQVCNAVHHAHRKGIIHRDLKPSNVLVAMGDNQPIAKVIDFGIAKALDARLTDATLFTEFGQMVGTLEYMSPEQAEMSVVDIDTRSDVYSLGVLLYRLLTGATPISKDRLMRSGFFEIPRVMRETVPLTPSAFVAAHDGAKRSEPTGRKSAKIGILGTPASDLDWIAMKCLAKDRRERYDSANELAEDLANFIAGRPVSAHPPSVGYRLRKLGTRHWVVIAISCVVACSLLFGVVGLVAGLSEARSARLEAEKSLSDAITEKDRADQAARSLAERMYSELVESAYRATQQNDSQRAGELLDNCLPDLRGWEWYFVRSEAKRISADLLRQNGQSGIKEIDLHDDRLILSVALVNGDVEVRHRASDRLLKSIHLDSPVATHQFGLDSLVVGTGGGDLYWYSLDDWAEQRRERLSAGGIYDIHFSPDRKVLAVCTGGGWVKVYDSHTFGLLQEWELPTRISKLYIDPEDQHVFGAGLDGQLYRMSIIDGSQERWFVSQASLTDVARLDRSRLCLLTRGVVIAVDTQQPDEPSELFRVDGVATSLAVDDRGRVAVTGADGTVTVIATSPNDRTLNSSHAFGISVGAAAWDAVKECFVVGIMDGRLLPLDAVRERNGWNVAIESNRSDAVLLPRNDLAVAADDNGTLHVADLRTGKTRQQKKTHRRAIWSVAVDADERFLAAVGEDNKLRCWELPSFELKFESAIGWGVRDVAISPDATFVAGPPAADSSHAEGTIGIWDIGTGQCVEVLKGHRNWVMTLAISPDGKHLVSGSENRDTIVWDTEDWDSTHVLEPRFRSPPQRLAFGPRDEIYIGHRDGWVTCWNRNTGLPQREWAAFGDAITGLDVTSDGRVLTTSRSSNELRVWDFDTTNSPIRFDLAVGNISVFFVSEGGQSLMAFGDAKALMMRSVLDWHPLE